MKLAIILLIVWVVTAIISYIVAELEDKEYKINNCIGVIAIVSFITNILIIMLSAPYCFIQFLKQIL